MSLDAPLAGPAEADLESATTLALRVAYGVLRRREDAEEIAQEAVVTAYRKLGSLREPERFRAWLVRIAWRLSLDRQRSYRRRERRERVVAEAPVATPTVEQLAISRQVAERVWAAVDALPEKLRAVVVLGSLEGYEVGEVAGLLGLPEGTVKSRLHLARRKLAETLRCLVSDTKKS